MEFIMNGYAGNAIYKFFRGIANYMIKYLCSWIGLNSDQYCEWRIRFIRHDVPFVSIKKEFLVIVW